MRTNITYHYHIYLNITQPNKSKLLTREMPRIAGCYIDSVIEYNEKDETIQN